MSRSSEQLIRTISNAGNSNIYGKCSGSFENLTAHARNVTICSVTKHRYVSVLAGLMTCCISYRF